MQIAEMKRTRIVFRADGDTNMGIGHIIRSLALADMLNSDFEVCFATSNQSGFIDNEILKVSAQKIKVVSEAEFLHNILVSDIVVVDGYHFTTEYLHAVRKKAGALVCIDDVPSKYFPADLIINHSPYAKREDYKTPTNTKFLLGWDYALLRRPFLEAAKSSKPRLTAKTLMVCMGGTDPYNLTSPFVQAAIKLRLFDQITVILPENSDIDSYVSNSKLVTVYKNVSAQEMATIMLANDVLISPASSVSIEGLATRMNLITMYYAENQRKLYEYITRNCLGFGILIDQPLDLSICMQELEKHQASFSSVKKSEVMIDGLQASRFLKTFKELESQSERIKQCEKIKT